MNVHLQSLVARRKLLIARSERLRAALVDDGVALAERWRLADEIVAAARSGLARLALLGGTALLVFGPKGRLLRAASRLVMFWPILRPLLPHLARFLRQR